MFVKGFTTLKDVFRAALWQKISALVFLFGSFAASVTEMVFLGFLYTLFSDSRKTAALEFIKNRSHILSLAQMTFIENNFTAILITSAVMVLLARLLFAISGRFALADIQVKTGTRLSNKLLSCFVDAHPSAWISWKKEKTVNIITYEAAASGEVVYTALNMVMSVMVMLSLLAVAYIISSKLTIFSLLIGLTVMAINYRNYAKSRRIGIVKIKSKEQLLGHIYDVVSGHKVLKLESGEDFAKEKSGHIIKDSHSWLLEKARNINMVMSFSELFIYFFFFGLVLAAHIFKVADQAVLLTLLVISIRLQGSVRELQTQWMNYQELLPNFLDVQKMLQHADAYIIKKKDNVRIDRGKEGAGGVAIRLDKVSFSYQSGEPLVIRDLDASFAAGQRFLIKGGSGSGKSTLINLICGALEPVSGSVTVDHERLTRDTFYTLRNSITYSSPDAYIFRGTLKDNISLGLSAGDDEVTESVKKAGLEDLLKRLDKGIYSHVTDNASNISLGERQRIMLARMFLKKPRLILLDEATSNLDLELEDRILANLIGNLPQATLIMVTHRAPKSFIFDKKFELKNGRLVEI